VFNSPSPFGSPSPSPPPPLRHPPTRPPSPGNNPPTQASPCARAPGCERVRVTMCDRAGRLRVGMQHRVATTTAILWRRAPHREVQQSGEPRLRWAGAVATAAVLSLIAVCCCSVAAGAARGPPSQSRQDSHSPGSTRQPQLRAGEIRRPNGSNRPPTAASASHGPLARAARLGARRRQTRTHAGGRARTSKHSLSAHAREAPRTVRTRCPPETSLCGRRGEEDLSGNSGALHTQGGDDETAQKHARRTPHTGTSTTATAN
jgi:hypothetical protein